MQQTHTICKYNNSNSWVILSPIEQKIKEKIEAVGTPLKDWDIQINYGIKTGLNDAFIISTEKREQILAACKNEEEYKKTAELIRPILRGRDIKRYAYERSDLWLIATFPSRKYDIDTFPSVKQYLLSFGKNRLEQSGEKNSRKKTNNKWFETQDSISYWEDFLKPKIMYPDISQKLSFCYCSEYIFCNNTVYFITSEKEEDLSILIKYLNSTLINWYYRTLSVQLGEAAVRMFSIYVLNIPIPKTKQELGIYESYNLSNDEIEFIESISCNQV